MKEKRCSKCKQKKKLNEFHKHKDHHDGRSTICSLCEQIRKFEFYGLTAKGYQDLFNIQNGCCAICGKHQSELKQRLHIDHDHETGIIRGLLCKGCNSTLERYIKYSKQIEKYIQTVPQRMIKFYKEWLE